MGQGLMGRGSVATLSALPGEGWDFGPYTYGLEPLTLPVVGAPDALMSSYRGRSSRADFAAACERIRGLGDPAAAAPGVEPGDAADELAWFRWITGHQVCFVIWRLMAQLLDNVAHRRRTPAAVLEPLSRYVDGYAALLLYTGSCSREIYQAVIRPSMRRCHRGFSGGWAPDFWPVRDVFRTHHPALQWEPEANGLPAAVRRHVLVHMGIAARLVPDGRSLLHEAGVRDLDRRLASTVYDSYFLTLRAPVPRHQVIAQLLRRNVAIAQDVAANGLYAGGDPDDLPPELRDPEVTALGDGLADVLSEVSRWACELGPGERVGPRRLRAAARR